MKLKKLLYIIIFLLSVTSAYSQTDVRKLPGNMQRCTVEYGDTLILVNLRPVYCFPKKVFKNQKQEKVYWRDVNDVKKTLPLAKLIHGIMLETYEYIETLPDAKSKDQHLKSMQKELYDTYMPVLKKLNFRQGKLLIKLIDRECKSSSYQLIQAYLGGAAAGFWQGFGKLFGVSLKASWDPNGEDKEMEKICIYVEYGYL